MRNSDVPQKQLNNREARLARRRLRDRARHAAQSISEAREAQLQRLRSNQQQSPESPEQRKACLQRALFNQ